MIYNPWFEMKGIEAVVVPVGVEPQNYPDLLKSLSALQMCMAPWSPCRTR